VLAPHYSDLSIKGYHEQLERALGGRADLRFVDSWHDEPGFVELLAAKIRGTDAHVVFTAHSLPARILESDDPYQDQLLETSRLVADVAGVSEWSFSFQSESPTGEPWLGPDILDHLPRARPKRVLLCPVGFVSDHLEIRWDLDVEAVELADELGIDCTDRDAERRPGFRAHACGDCHGDSCRYRQSRGTPERSSSSMPRAARVPAGEPRAEGSRVRASACARVGCLALRDVSFGVEPGSAVGLVGRNGSGKTTSPLSGIVKPTSGRVAVGGRIGSLLELARGSTPT
jgi:ABC-type multidrug transport system fused ATPase/permease subunit